jgi:predicted lipid-binding transport protein (Tim44 family)
MGGDNAVLIEIIIFAMIAAFLVHRLRSVLGRRTGEERQRPNPFSGPEETPAARDNVIPLPARNRAERAGPVADASVAETEEPQSLAARLERIHAADANFDEKGFLIGARAAFEMIVSAFAAGDLRTLRPLLADDVYGNFAKAVQDRQAAGETLETRIEALRDADVVDARLDGSVIHLTIRFVSDQINVTRDGQGVVVDGDLHHAVEVIDIWTFSRDARSRNPNWALVETRAPN